MPHKTIKPIKAWAVIDKEGVIFNIKGMIKGNGEPLAIFELNNFNEDILKLYNAKIIPVLITHIKRKKLIKRKE